MHTAVVPNPLAVCCALTVPLARIRQDTELPGVIAWARTVTSTRLPRTSWVYVYGSVRVPSSTVDESTTTVTWTGPCPDRSTSRCVVGPSMLLNARTTRKAPTPRHNTTTAATIPMMRPTRLFLAGTGGWGYGPYPWPNGGYPG